MKILVIGAGAWGTAMAISAATHPEQGSVRLWARDPAQAQLMQAERANSRYLPGIRFPDALTVVSGDVMAHVADADLIVLGGGLSNMQHLYATVPGLMARHVFGDVARTPVVQAKHGDSSGVFGAARLWDST